MSYDLIREMNSIVFGGSEDKRPKPKRVSRKQRMADLEEAVRKLRVENEELRASLSYKTAVYTPYSPWDMGLLGPRKPTNRTVYAAEAIKLIANHLGIRFNDIAPKNIVEPIPPPVEHDDEDYDDE